MLVTFGLDLIKGGLLNLGGGMHSSKDFQGEK